MTLLRTTSLTGILLALCVAFPAIAQQAPAADTLVPIISGPDEIVVGRTLVLDASSSKGLGEDTTYRWFVGGVSQPISRTVEVVYTPERTDTLTMRLHIRTTVEGEVREAEVEKVIIVYQRKIVLIADTTVPTDKVELHRQTAAEEGTYLRVIRPTDTAVRISAEETLATLIGEEDTTLQGAQAIIIWTDGMIGLQALMRASEGNTQLKQSLEGQTLVVITDRGLQTFARTTHAPFTVLSPDRILITRKEAVNPLLSSQSPEEFLTTIEQRDIDLLIVDASSIAIRPWNLLSTLVTSMLTHGVSSQIVILLLTLPLIAMILAFLKQVIGITTFGLYTPSIITLSFLALGWKIGLTFLLFIIFTGYITRMLLKRWRMLYIPRVAIVITVVSITLLLLLGLAAAFSITFGRDTIFVLLIMSTLAESFLTIKTEEGLWSAVLGTGETIVASLVCAWIVSWSTLQSILLAYPEVILFTIVADAALGQWTGLRLVEYFRFREVFKHLQEE
ncbi:hypothetical protein COU80_02145 [Candidatus Peregrinibacteria bacterium CG10_big_fil_rev_8_21_14_0_10_55_24]|nr:MAG: hypothetical protein COU80_02145 [Candidatus Peregrinibacteria bacterium CG10_big_fil_rev_8_21_14_0_10_55_24]